MVSTATPPPRRDRSDSEWSAAKGAEGLKRREVVSPDRKDRKVLPTVQENAAVQENAEEPFPENMESPAGRHKRVSWTVRKSFIHAEECCSPSPSGHQPSPSSPKTAPARVNHTPPGFFDAPHVPFPDTTRVSLENSFNAAGPPALAPEVPATMLRLFEHLPVDPANDRRKLSIFEHIESQAPSPAACSFQGSTHPLPAQHPQLQQWPQLAVAFESPQMSQLFANLRVDPAQVQHHLEAVMPQMPMWYPYTTP
ncbi:unnamed protein product [Effrenium voratum]|nr:unnamed protein product [Effrenium voratum]